MTVSLPQPGPEQVIPRRRLHPLTPVLKGLRTLVVIVAAVSWRGLQDLGVGNWLLAVGALLLLTLAFSAVSWRFTGFEVVGHELRIHEGVLARRVRAVPLERLQAVEVRQSALARLAGLAELRLDVAGAEKAEAPLAFLPLPEAVALRARLLALGGVEAAEEPEREPGPAEAALPGQERAQEQEHAPDLFRVDNNHVLISQVLTPPVMLAPFAALYIVGQLVFNDNHGFFAIASMLTAVFGTLGRPAMSMLNFWDFRVRRSPDGNLRIRHGRLETRSQTVPVRRVQSLTVTWPLLWRGQSWLRVSLAVAGQSSGDGRNETDRLLPVADLETARRIVPLALPGVDIAGLPLGPPPPQARYLGPLRARVLAAGFDDQAFATVDGVLTRTLTLVPYQRIQSVRLSQGPLQRRLGLATVHVDVAGSVPATAPHRSLAQAYAWADELSSRARAARAAA